MATQSSIQLIRNATIVFSYAGKQFLIDPMLANKDAYPGFPGTANDHLRNPLVPLPVSIEGLLKPDAVIVTHLHPDHWDEVAVAALPKDKPVFAQNGADAKMIGDAGFTDVRVFAENTIFENVKIHKMPGQHGSDEAYAIPEVAAILGQSSGLLFNQDGEKSVYFLGDTIWIDEVAENLMKFQPDVVVVNAGYAYGEATGVILMGKEDIYRINQLLPHTTIIAIHLEAINHCMLSREELRAYVNEMGIAHQVIIPKDGEVMAL